MREGTPWRASSTSFCTTTAVGLRLLHAFNACHAVQSQANMLTIIVCTSCSPTQSITSQDSELCCQYLRRKASIRLSESRVDSVKPGPTWKMCGA